MVFNEALCAANLASAVLANGVCCFYQMRREEMQKQEQETTIRQTIYSEWERQRYLDMVERHEAKEQLYSKLQDERRINLMVTKQASNNAVLQSNNLSTHLPDLRDPPQISIKTTSGHDEKGSINGSVSYSSDFSRQCSLKFQGPKRNIFSGGKSSFHIYRTSPISSNIPGTQYSSLMDDCDDDFEEVRLE